MTVSLLSTVPVPPVTIPGSAVLSFVARASAPTTVDVDCTINDPNVVFSNGTDSLHSPGHPVGTGPTTVSLIVDLKARGPIPPNFTITGEVTEHGIWQFEVQWPVQVLNPTPTARTLLKGPKGRTGGKRKNEKKQPKPRASKGKKGAKGRRRGKKK